MSIYLVSVSSPQVSVLVVEDDPGIATQLVRGLERAGYAADSVAMGAEALRRPPSDVVLLDLGLPDVDGMDVCRRLRADSDAAIIVVTARGEEANRVLALDEGADDYLVKPFGLAELLARIRAVLRRGQRTNGGGATAEVLRHGPLTVDLRTRKVTMFRPGGRADPEGVRHTRVPGHRPRPADQPAGDRRAGLGRALVRADQGTRRPPGGAAPQAGRPRA